MQKRRGFTLIELIVAISIVGILSTLGFGAYNQAQMRGRDAKRKQDLRAIAIALEVYFNRNGRFPCDGRWTTNSNNTTNWVADEPSSGCSTAPEFSPTYVNIMPKDPINSAGNAWVKGNYNYGYADANWGTCLPRAQSYFLWAQLENPNDSDRYELNTFSSCGNPAATPASGDFMSDGWLKKNFVIYN